MKVYSFSKPSSNMPLFNVVHVNMHNGTAGRPAMPIALPVSFFAPAEKRAPMQIARSGIFVPDVFSPSGAGSWGLIVSEKVKEELSCLPHVDFLRIKFVKLVNRYYAKGDFNYPKDGYAHEMLERLPNDPQLFDGMGRYYEVLFPCLREVLPQLKGTVDENDVPRWTLIAADLMTEYPIIWDCMTIMSENAFGILDKYFDKDFFVISERTIK